VRPSPLHSLLGDEADFVAELVAEVARYVLKTGESVRFPGAFVVYRKARRGGIVNGTEHGLRFSIAARAVKETRVAA